MNSIENTFSRALKVWWSFSWRALVLWLPVGFAMACSMFWFLPFPKPGQPNAPMTADQLPGFIGRFFALWLLMMTAAVIVQAFAMRWMLRTRWSDFKLVALPPD